ncbi:MAG: FKBP-type peptidyl-prolyl cis-trans isomerase [Ginsengibacter sp.]
MKKIFSFLVLSMILFSSCMKNDNKCNFSDRSLVVPPTELKGLEDSLVAHNITNAIKDPNGFYYTIGNVGTGKSVSNLCSVIYVSYKGKFFNGSIFDATPSGQLANFQLGEVIEGWRKGIPLIKGGGDITLYIPPTLGYGAQDRPDGNGNIAIPKNSYLVFEVHVESIQ